MDTSAFTGQFVEEARDRLKSLANALVRLEAEPLSAEIIAEIFRDAHSLKGSAQMLGFVDISQIAHQLEDLFVAAKRDVRVIDGRAIDLVFRSLDLIAVRVEELARGKTTPDAAPDVAPDSEPPAAASRRRAAPGQSLRVAIEKLDSLTHLAPEMVIQSLKASERHSELRRVEFSIARLRDRVREARLAPPARSRVAELGEYADTLDANTRRMRSLVTNFSDDQARMTLITEELRQHVIELTMLPVGTVFDTFPRAVRDLARSFDKQVELTMTGRETELEKRVIEKIADPLVHLVRNAIDHGLELPDERTRAGKPPAGALLIAAEQHGNRCHITVRDDGRGIDPAALRAAAIRKGIAPASELDQWTNERLFNLIFEPGFSTRTETTDVSGRGVGMDVVRNNIELIGGTVELKSTSQAGTIFIIKIPLTLAIMAALIVEASGHRFAIPQFSVIELVRTGKTSGHQVELINDTAVLRLRDKLLPLLDLAQLLQLEGAQPTLERLATNILTVVVIQIGTRLFGVLVDSVFRTEEIVVKPMSSLLRDVAMFSGNTILGDGSVIMIVDPNALGSIVGPVEGQPGRRPLIGRRGRSRRQPLGQMRRLTEARGRGNEHQLRRRPAVQTLAQSRARHETTRRLRHIDFRLEQEDRHHGLLLRARQLADPRE